LFVGDFVVVLLALLFGIIGSQHKSKARLLSVIGSGLGLLFLCVDLVAITEAKSFAGFLK
jgi:hypothetical protein